MLSSQNKWFVVFSADDCIEMVTCWTFRRNAPCNGAANLKCQFWQSVSRPMIIRSLLLISLRIHAISIAAFHHKFYCCRIRCFEICHNLVGSPSEANPNFTSINHKFITTFRKYPSNGRTSNLHCLRAGGVVVFIQRCPSHLVCRTGGGGGNLCIYFNLN